jgi:hypothetical protein
MATESQSSVIHYLLGGLLVFGALNAFAGGYYGLAGAKGVPTEWLAGTPFSDYTVPSLILFGILGDSFLVAPVAVFGRARIAKASALTAGAIVLVWIAVQVAIIGYVSWMQPATAIGGLLILMLAWALPNPAVSRRAARAFFDSDPMPQWLIRLSFANIRSPGSHG